MCGLATNPAEARVGGWFGRGVSSDLEGVRVCTGPGWFGRQPARPVLDGPSMAGPGERQRRAAELGCSEAVFVDDTGRGVADICAKQPKS
jgi:hypothetical protein